MKKEEIFMGKQGGQARSFGADEIDWRTVIVFVSIAFSSQCGGGFAAGSTPWSYFFMACFLSPRVLFGSTPFVERDE